MLIIHLSKKSTRAFFLVLWQVVPYFEPVFLKLKEMEFLKSKFLKRMITSDKMNKITLETLVNAPIEKVWDAWIAPEHITKWNYAN